jgi:hypothetical protein
MTLISIFQLTSVTIPKSNSSIGTTTNNSLFVGTEGKGINYTIVAVGRIIILCERSGNILLFF